MNKSIRNTLPKSIDRNWWKLVQSIYIMLINPLRTSPEYTRAGVYGNCVLEQNQIVFNGLIFIWKTVWYHILSFVITSSMPLYFFCGRGVVSLMDMSSCVWQNDMWQCIHVFLPGTWWFVFTPSLTNSSFLCFHQSYVLSLSPTKVLFHDNVKQDLHVLFSL